jgi:hypothetical protein
MIGTVMPVPTDDDGVPATSSGTQAQDPLETSQIKGETTSNDADLATLNVRHTECPLPSGDSAYGPSSVTLPLAQR